MIKIITQSTKERNEEFEEKYEKYKKLFYNTNLSIPEIRKELQLSESNRIVKDINRRWKQCEMVSSHKRARLIGRGEWI
ncbi:MAG: hypothetical protein IJ104_00885 [Methanobrevibacter sp.]|nr:hypothetical protein [Methanobrevibacter sp.]MBQ9024925.1 hypothetical protein [Methanobrevibacter sp.]